MKSAARLSNPVVMDFDDLTDTNDRFDLLQRMKERDDGFKVTLFAIPTRLNDVTLAKYAGQRHWIELAVHGWRHTRHECLAWTWEETQEKVREATKIYPHFARIFKAPNWETCDEMYEGLRKADFAVADHIRNIELMPRGMTHYTYNVRLRDDKYQRMHGHVQDWGDTGLSNNYKEWTRPAVGTPYLFISEVLQDEQDIQHRAD